ncbi:MAG: SprT-like domain-containing protein [Hyphomicrobiales bacterium]
MEKTKLITLFKDFIPHDAVHDAIDLILKYNISIKITRSRKTKLGDYSFYRNQKTGIITINHDLSPEQFLLTLLHEMAHHITRLQYGDKITPHGKEWKQEIRKLLLPFYSNNVFPVFMLEPLKKYLQKPTATMAASPDLYKALREIDHKKRNINPKMLLDDLKFDEFFSFENKGVFKKIKKRRSRIVCLSMTNQRLYLFYPFVEITLEDK